MSKYYSLVVTHTILLATCSFLFASCFDTEKPNQITFHATGDREYPSKWRSVLSSDYQAIWISPDGTDGWIVGMGNVLHYSKIDGWKKDKTGSEILGGFKMESLWMNSGGTEGWAVGENIIAHYTAQSGWFIDSASSSLGSISLNDIWMNADGTEGWAVGYDQIIHYKVGKGWIKDVLAPDIKKTPYLKSVSMNADATEGWAVGSSVMFHYTLKKGWENYVIPNKKKNDLNFECIWVKPDGSEAWAGGASLMHYDSKHEWKDVSGSGSGALISLLCMNDSGNKGLAIGFEGLIQYKVDKGWEVLKSPFSEKNLNAVCMTSDGNEVWIVESGAIHHYTSGKGWEFNIQVSNTIRRTNLESISMLKDGSEGWAVGDSSIIHYTISAGWKQDTSSDKLISKSQLASVWIKDDGDEGWAVGKGIIIFYKSGEGWQENKKDSKNTYGGQLRSVWMEDNAKEGWAVGDGLMMHYDKKTGWEKDKLASDKIGSAKLFSVMMTSDGNEGWAVGAGVIVHYLKGDGWEIDKQGTATIDDEQLHAIWLKHDGSEGWAVGESLDRLTGNSKIFHYVSHKGWQLFADRLILQPHLNSISLNRNGGDGWAMGGESSVLGFGGVNIARFTEKRGWEDFLGFGGTRNNAGINSVHLSANGKEGWAVGEAGLVMEYKTADYLRLDKLSQEDTKNILNLSDSITLKFSDKIYGLELSLGPEKDSIDYLNSYTNKPYQVRYGIDSTGTITFSKNAGSSLDPLRGKIGRFVLRAKVDPNLNQWQSYSSNSFPVGETSLRKKIVQGAVYTGLFLLTLNILLLILAIPFPWFRKNIFGADLVSLLGLFSVKGIITKPLIQWVRPLKMVMLHEYRREITNIPYLSQWKLKNKSYNPPPIGNSVEIDPINSIWEMINHDNKSLWLIEGRSGLGKTALLEQITLKALVENKTPILLKLSTFQSGGISLQRLFEEYGQLVVDAGTAEELVKNGGFYVLLDGLNETRDQEGVRLFVKSILRNNIVVISSQFEPDWPDIFKTKIDLRPFGRTQLTFLLENNKGMVEELMKATYLFDLNYSDGSRKTDDSTMEVGLLPFTATLIADFIKVNNKIPENRLTVYRELLKNLIEEPQYINLEKKAWKMFCENSQNIEPDNMEDSLDSIFLDKARGEEVLTKFVLKQELFYRFRHERIFRFIVASYLFRKSSDAIIEDLHGQLTKGQDKLYWSDVIEFWSELLTEDALKSKHGFSVYKVFILNIGKFEPLILKKRLIRQYNLLIAQLPEQRESEFDEKLLVIMSNEGKDI